MQEAMPNKETSNRVGIKFGDKQEKLGSNHDDFKGNTCFNILSLICLQLVG